MFLYGLSSLVFWILLMMAVFAVMRRSAWSGRQSHPYQGYGAPGPYDQPGPRPGLGQVTAETVPLAVRSAWRGRSTTVCSG
jgi:hypothetical protein